MRPFSVRVEVLAGDVDMDALTLALEAFEASLSRGLDGRLILHMTMYGQAASDARVAALAIAECATGLTPLVCEVARGQTGSNRVMRPLGRRRSAVPAECLRGVGTLPARRCPASVRWGRRGLS